MSNSVSSLGNYISSVNLMQASQTELQKLSEQNSTGQKSTSMAGYGTDAPTILNLQSTIQQTQSWVDNSTQIGTYLSAYNVSLGQLSSDGTQLQTALNSLNTGNTDPAQLQTLIQGLEADVGATLNSQVGDRFIYAGNRYTTAPVVDLSTLTTPTAPAALVLADGTASPPTIPNYDTAYATTSPPGQVTSGTPYYSQQTVNIANNDTLSFGVTSNDPSIQNLIYALKQAQAGAAATSPTSDQFFANAKAALTTALTGLTTLQQQNAQNQNTVSSEQAIQKTTISTMQTQLGNLTQVDAATVATELTSVENELSATYKATASLLNLSLLTYL